LIFNFFFFEKPLAAGPGRQQGGEFIFLYWVSASFPLFWAYEKESLMPTTKRKSFAMENPVFLIVNHSMLNDRLTFAGERQLALVMQALYSWLEELDAKHRWVLVQANIRFKRGITLGESVLSKARVGICEQGTAGACFEFYVSRGAELLLASRFTIVLRRVRRPAKLLTPTWEHSDFSPMPAVDRTNPNDLQRLMKVALDTARHWTSAEMPRAPVPFVRIRFGESNNSPIRFAITKPIFRSEHSKLVKIGVLSGSRPLGRLNCLLTIAVKTA